MTDQMQCSEYISQKRIHKNQQTFDSNEIESVLKQYNQALTWLDQYDHQSLEKPQGKPCTVVITYENCKKIIGLMGFDTSGILFGNEKDESFKSSIAAIYQSFNRQDLYPTVEEKAAYLLYFITKNHSFTDGNKRIAAAIFIYFLFINGFLYKNELEIISNKTIVSLVIMIASSHPREKENMIKLTMNLLS